MMNDPRLDVLDELNYAREHDFDFLDLTLEPPGTTPETLNIEALKKDLKQSCLDVVGHTAFYLPFDSLYPDLRAAAAKEIIRNLDAFSGLGCRLVTVHLHTSLPFFILEEMNTERLSDVWSRFLELIMPEAQRRGQTLMLENCPSLQSIDLISQLLGRFEKLGFHLDVGHANLGGKGNQTRAFLEHFGSRLRHVHLSDNFGGDDLHLPIGAGRIDWRDVIKAIKHLPYDGTITLEVFTPDRDYVLMSRDKVRKLWALL